MEAVEKPRVAAGPARTLSSHGGGPRARLSSRKSKSMHMVYAMACHAPTNTLPACPVPTVASSGYPGFAAAQCYGLFAPKNIPQAAIRMVEAGVASVTAHPRLRAQMWQRGTEIRYLPAAGLAPETRTDSARRALIPAWACYFEVATVGISPIFGAPSLSSRRSNVVWRSVTSRSHSG